MKRRGRRGGHGDWLAPTVALGFVVLLAWVGAHGLERFGWRRPWGPSPLRPPGAASDVPRAAGRDAPEEPVVSASPGPQAGYSIMASPSSSRPAIPPRMSAGVETPAVVTSSDIDTLRRRRLLLPVRGADAARLRSNFHEARGNRLHEAMDILAPRGEPVLAVDDGSIAKLFTSERGGLTVYHFDPSREYVYYYAHLDGYAPGLHEGAQVTRGQVLGYVGTTGNAPKDTPHLHFSIYKLRGDQRWWQGEPLDPYLVLK
jgi:murein DD-endopeptidase MepM/ murein hydrolase activator NlpD